MLQHFTWITAAGKGDCEFFRIDLFYSVSVGLIKAGVAVYFVEIIDTEIIARRFVFNNVMLAEYSAYGFLNGKIPQLFNNKDINLRRLFAQQIFFLHLQKFHFLFQGNAERRAKSRMPL